MKVGAIADIANMLLSTAIIAFLVWFAKFHWNRRSMYKLAAKIPGPPGYPIIGNGFDWMGVSTRKLFQTATRYFLAHPDIGKMWLGPKLIISLDKPEYVEIVLNHSKCLAKDPSYNVTKGLLGNGLFSAPVHIWKKNRKLINPTFNQKILDSFVIIFAEQAKIFTEVLKKQAGRKNVDLMPLISAFMIDSICETAMGVNVAAQTSSNRFGELLDRFFKICLIRILNIWYRNKYIFTWSRYKSIADVTAHELKNFTQKVVAEKRKLFQEETNNLKRGEIVEGEKTRKRLLELLLQLSYEGIKLTEEELRDEVNTFMVGGTETTGGTLCFCFMALGMYPEIQQKVYEEVIDVLGFDRDVTNEDLPRLQYLERVIKETLRLFPPGSYFLRTASTDIDLGDYVIPAGSAMCLSPFITQRSSKYWKDPLKFDPDRFLPEEVAQRHPYSYFPFSRGPRNCIGSKYAVMIMKTVIATLVRTAIFKSEYKTIEDVDLKLHLLLRPTYGYKLSLELRE